MIGSKTVAPAVVAAGVLVAVFVLVAIGSVLYWWADGAVGTPEEFQSRVQAQGLDVAWINSGPRAGSGVVETECGPVTVTINDFDGELWIGTGDEARPLTRELADDLVACGPGE